MKSYGNIVICDLESGKRKSCEMDWGSKEINLSICFKCGKESGIHFRVTSNAHGRVYVVKKPHALWDDYDHAGMPLCMSCADAIRTLHILGKDIGDE